MNNTYLLGLFFGIVTAIIAYLIVWMFFGGKHIKGNEFDERQYLVRGKAYRYGFFGIIFALLPLMIAFEWNVRLPVTPGFAMFLAMLIGIDVYAVYSIMNDAYFGIDANKTKLTVFFAIIILVNALCGWINLKDVLSQGIQVIDLHLGANAAVAAAFLPVVIAMVVKNAADSKEDADEESQA